MCNIDKGVRTDRAQEGQSLWELPSPEAGSSNRKVTRVLAAPGPARAGMALSSV